MSFNLPELLIEMLYDNGFCIKMLVNIVVYDEISILFFQRASFTCVGSHFCRVMLV